MAQIAILVLAGTDNSGDTGRAVNALEAAQEFKEAGDDFKLIFDGAGTQWIKVLSDPEHNYHDLYARVKDDITGVCQYCANAYGAKDAAEREEVPLLHENDGHPSIQKLVAEGRQVITF